MKKVFISSLLSFLAVSSFAFYERSGGFGIEPKASSSQRAEALEFLNSIRDKTGLNRFSANEVLDNASLNHAIWQTTNNKFSHYQSEGSLNFTGVSPKDRALYLGYQSIVVGENISWNSKDVAESVDGLMTAIYHRLGFLDFSKDEIGVGIDGAYYVYVTGNSKLNGVCSKDSYEGLDSHYKEVCADTAKKIEKDEYESARDELILANPKIVVYPTDGELDFTPVFYDESPDPLPGYDVSGNPISIQFNPLKSSNIVMNSLKLFDSSGEEVSVKFMDKSSDHNGKFTEYEFALFPLERLDWGSKYSARAEWSEDGVLDQKEWSFTTKSLDGLYYISNSTKDTLKIKENTKYYIYLKPLHKNDLSNSIETKASPVYDGSEPFRFKDFGFVDRNTVYVEATGSEENSGSMIFPNREIVLEIAKEDSAITSQPQTENNSSVDCNKFAMNRVVSTKNWHMIGAVSEGCSVEGLKALGAKSVFPYDPTIGSSGSYKTSGTIEVGEGFWLKSEAMGGSSSFEIDSFSSTTNDCNENVIRRVKNSNWHILSATSEGCSVEGLKALGAKSVFPYDPTIGSSGSYKTSGTIEVGEGFWLKK